LSEDKKVITRDFSDCTGASVYSQPVFEALARLQAQTKTALGTAPDSVYIYDLVDQNSTHLSYSVAELLGYTAEQMNGLGGLGLAGLIHPADVEAVSEHFQRFTTLHPNEVIAIEYRMMGSDGEWCWLRSLETPLVLAVDGFPLQILGLVHTICTSVEQSSQQKRVLSRAC
jgi:PAS domain S-box-containing protein